jgi:transposase
MSDLPLRFIGLDIHKEYFVAVGVNQAREVVFGPHKASVYELDDWITRHLSKQDSVVLEMTTNTYQFYDSLLPHVHSVIAVHPPDVLLVTNVPIKTDKKAALALAQLHAVGLLKGVWIPPHEVRDMRALIAHRQKIVRLSAIAKNRLHAVLHRGHLRQRKTWQMFSPEERDWWLELPLKPMERIRVQSDLDLLDFAQKQIGQIDDCINQQAAADEHIPLLIQLPGIGPLTAITILAAIGDIRRFPSDRQLVGYAGLGTRVHSSGQTHVTGRITKTGRRDLRRAMVNAANHAVVNHPYWKEMLAKMEPRMGRSKAIVAIARKLLVAVWHVLHEEVADCHADTRDIACSLFRHAYKVGVRNLPEGQSALAFTRNQMDRLGIGADMDVLPWGRKRFKLPPSKLLLEED